MLSGSPLSKYWSIIPRHLCFISGSLSFDRHTKLSFFLAAFTITSIAGFQCHAIQNISK